MTGGKRADLLLRGHDAFGRETAERIKSVYVGPLFYFWLGADAYPQLLEVASISISGDFT